MLAHLIVEIGVVTLLLAKSRYCGLFLVFMGWQQAVAAEKPAADQESQVHATAHLAADSARPSYPAKPFVYPNGARNAVSLTFDDGLASQVQFAVPLLEKYQVKATFYVLPFHVSQQVKAWREAAQSGQEIGNHTNAHTCTGNFHWLRKSNQGLEQVDLDFIRSDIERSQQYLQRTLGVTPKQFAFPCGNTFVGRGRQTQSYVPLVADMFETARTWNDETGNDPRYADFAQLTGLRMDGLSFSELRELLENERETDKWLVLAGHEVGSRGVMTTDLKALEQLIQYLQDPKNGYWLAPVGEVSSYIKQQRADN